MENANAILEKVSIFFSELMGNQMPPVSGVPAVEPVKMVEAKLKDGTVVSVSEMAVGGIVTIAGAPAPVGEHLLEDGTTLIVGDNGAIMEIKPAMATEEPPMMEDMGAKFSAFEAAQNEKFAAYEISVNGKFAAYEAKLGQANKVIEGLMQISKMLVEAPQAGPDQSVKTSNAFNEESKDTKAEFEKFSKSICS